MENEVIALNVPSGHKLVLEQNTPKIKQPNYYKIGNGTMNRDGIQAIDFIGEMIRMTKPAQTVIGWIKDGMVYETSTKGVQFVVKVIPDTNAGMQVLKKGFKELFEKDLVRRVKRSHYMINPRAMVIDFPVQSKLWDSSPMKDTSSTKDSE